jgi:hypothetical protein
MVSVGAVEQSWLEVVCRIQPKSSGIYHRAEGADVAYTGKNLGGRSSANQNARSFSGNGANVRVQYFKIQHCTRHRHRTVKRTSLMVLKV